jgi:hypothetical protein
MPGDAKTPYLQTVPDSTDPLLLALGQCNTKYVSSTIIKLRKGKQMNTIDKVSK